ncbi:MAG: MMPL family transporter, partial [Steroidobacter sp.]
MSAFLPRSPTPTQQILVDQLREGVVSQLLLVKVTNAPTDQLAEISNDLARQLDNSTEFGYVNNGATQRFLDDGRILFQQRYLLSPGVTSQRFTVAGLREALENDLDLLSSSFSGAISQSLPADPTGELSQLMDRLQPQGGPQKKSGLWFSRDGESALLILQTRAAGFDLGAQKRALNELQKRFAMSIQQHHVPAAKLVVTGPGVIALSTQESMKRDVSRISLLALLFVSILLLTVYRSP